jgi:hypothetical protein
MDRWAEPLIMESMESLEKFLAGAFPFLVRAASIPPEIPKSVRA